MILEGTTSSGAVVPVQVTNDGKVVAEGRTGPEGPQGPEGPEGPEGPQGPAGSPGNLWSGSDPGAIYYTGGSVGIGTTSPNVKLTITETANANGIVVRNADTNGSLLQFGINTAIPAAYIQSTNDGTGTTQPLAFYVGTSERGRFDTSGRLLVGTSTADTSRFGTNTYTPQFQVKGAWQNGSASITCTNDYPALWLNGTGGTISGAGVGIISFNGYDGSNYTQAATIKAEVDGAASANNMPGRLVFSTTASGSSSPTERMRIDSRGDVVFQGAPVIKSPNGSYWAIEVDDSGNLSAIQTI